MYFDAALTPNDKAIIACDFDDTLRSAAILENETGQRTIEVEGRDVSYPSSWGKHICRIKWAEKDVIVVWPICRPNGGGSSVAKIKISSQPSHFTLQLGHPLDIFVHEDRLVCTTSEESDPNVNPIAAYSYPRLERLASFLDAFHQEFSSLMFLEVEHGCLNAPMREFWFVADNIDKLWNFNVDTGRAQIHTISASRSSLVAICAIATGPRLISRGDRSLEITDYRRSGDLIEPHKRQSVDIQDQRFLKLWRGFETGGAWGIGYPNGSFALSDRGIAVLIQSPS